MVPREPNPTPAARRSRDDIVDAALALLDRVGLPDLSMRRLADDLGVQPSALYWHVASKQDLLAAVSSRILSPIELVPGLDAATAAVALGHRLHDLLLAHRDGAEVVSSSLALGLVEPPLRGPFAEVEGDTGAAAAIADAVTHFVVGFTFHEQQRRAADALGAAATGARLSPDEVADGTDGGFDAALALISAGIRAGSTRA